MYNSWREEIILYKSIVLNSFYILIIRVKCLPTDNQLNEVNKLVKKIIEGFLKKIIDNCKLIEDYEIDNLTNKYIYELASEDNFYISYFCKYLENEIKQYQKEYYGLKSYSTTKQHKKHKRCKECGKLIEIKSKKDYSTKYCGGCKHKKDLEKYARYNAKRKSKMESTTKLNPPIHP